jgi:hypothetical protein
LYVGFSEKFEFFPDEFDAFSVRAIHKHHIGFDFLFISVVYFIEEIMDNRPFAGSRRSMNNNIGYFVGFVKIIEFVLNIFMDR